MALTLRVTDHALLRFLERAGAVDVEGLRQQLAAGLARSVAAAERLGSDRVTVIADGLVYVVRDGTLITVKRVGRG